MCFFIIILASLVSSLTVHCKSQKLFAISNAHLVEYNCGTCIGIVTQVNPNISSMTFFCPALIRMLNLLLFVHGLASYQLARLRGADYHKALNYKRLLDTK